MLQRRKFAPVHIPLHGKGDALTKIALWAEMAAMNPSGFRELSTKKNRRRTPTKKIGSNGRFLSRPEQLAKELPA